MADTSSAASTGTEPAERDGRGERAPTEIIESKKIYRGFIALRLATLRLADGARVSEWRLWRGTPVLPEANPVGALSARCCPLGSAQHAGRTTESGRSGSMDHRRLRRVGSLRSGAPSHTGQKELLAATQSA
jgi:hypothetical protein